MKWSIPPGTVTSATVLALACSAPDPADSTTKGSDTMTGSGEASDDPGGLSGACPSMSRLGGFAVTLEADEYSTVAGQVADGVVPGSILLTLHEEGPCRLVEHANPFCDPPCTGLTTCGLDGECVPYPEPKSLGTVTVGGLVAAVSMEPTSINTYTETELPHPAFEPGASIELSAKGDTLPGFDLGGLGFSALEPIAQPWIVRAGEPIDVQWSPPTTGDPVSTQVALAFSVDQHGVVPQQIICVVPDTGQYTVGSGLVDLLLAAGVSGFPNAYLRRRTADSLELGGLGCVDFVVRSVRVPQIEVR